MSDALNKEIVTALRALIRNEVKAALAEFNIETTPGRPIALMQEALASYDHRADQMIKHLESLDV